MGSRSPSRRSAGARAAGSPGGLAPSAPRAGRRAPGGSLGGSGDLAPLAHIALVMIGEGEAYVGEKRMPGGAALRAAGLKPLRLEAKEGLAILNGTAVMAGLGCLLVADALGLLKDAEIAASVSFEALRGSPAPFDARLSRLKKQVGQHLVAGNRAKPPHATA